MKVFTDIYVDDVIDGKRRNPLIPNDCEIIEIGVGESFEKRYKTKYKINDVVKSETTAEKTMRQLQSIVNEQRGLLTPLPR